LAALFSKLSKQKKKEKEPKHTVMHGSKSSNDATVPSRELILLDKIITETQTA
jgi:orotate phosphoribosyltransferase-like protein